MKFDQNQFVFFFTFFALPFVLLLMFFACINNLVYEGSDLYSLDMEAKMALISLRQLLDHAAENNYGVAAFNVNNLEQIQAIMEAAKETNSPVILQASRGARSYTNDVFLRHLILGAVELYPDIPVVMHQDHGNSLQTCLSAIRNGFTSVMMDGSLKEDAKTPSDFEYNVRITADVVRIAHSMGISVEGELGCLGSLETGKGEKEDGHGFEGTLSHDQLLTDPVEAAQFVELTKVDALAIAIGTSLFNKKFDNAIIDRFVFYGAFGFVNTSFASNNKTMLYVDTNYPDALVGILAYKSFVTAGFSYSYFSGLRINIGGNF